MKKLFTSAIALLSLCAYAPAQNIEHQVVVSQFAAWQLFGQQALVAGSNTVVPFLPCRGFAGGKQFNELADSTPIRIVDPGNSAIDETITPTKVVVGEQSCSATLAPRNAHPLPYYVVSGTAGLQEAINANAVSGTFNTAILDKNFYSANGSSAIITSAAGSANLPLVDVTFAPYVTYRFNGTAYITNSTNAGGATAPTATAGVAAGTSPTGPTNTGNGDSFSVALTTGTATTTGILFSEQWASGTFGATAPNCTVRSIGNNFAPAFTFAASYSSGGELVVTATVAPAASTAYAFQVSCQ